MPTLGRCGQTLHLAPFFLAPRSTCARNANRSAGARPRPIQKSCFLSPCSSSDSMKRQTKERNIGPKVQMITIVAKAICVHMNFRSRSSGIRGQLEIGFKLLESGISNEVFEGWSLHYFIYSVLSFF
ncbi:hypothetical protein CTAM01_08055 [Colletotrichum tamarilloi]|uniref:Uncharacterized protein n=1 Tax=Colletotrichum tamarilloi TaxID=1209934 RepID=A0ABQ9R737_9PEZI|nr:uncharacterized protein CTAM01_08055 [Colletotrichum tamarilloi]KAK1497043.1 hypothetical protein CTAM01_08055 [Colletotrichum tamarilloi]